MITNISWCVCACVLVLAISACSNMRVNAKRVHYSHNASNFANDVQMIHCCGHFLSLPQLWLYYCVFRSWDLFSFYWCYAHKLNVSINCSNGHIDTDGLFPHFNRLKFHHYKFNAKSLDLCSSRPKHDDLYNLPIMAVNDVGFCSFHCTFSSMRTIQLVNKKNWTFSLQKPRLLVNWIWIAKSIEELSYEIWF